MKKLLIIISISGLFACGNNDNTKNKETKDSTNTQDVVTEEGSPEFEGTIVYKNTTEGDPEGVKAFESFAPKQYVVSVRNNMMRVQELGGLLGLNLFLNFNDSTYYQIDNKSKGYFVVYRSTKDFPKIQVENTGEVETIMGHQCTKYHVVSSPFVNKNSSQDIWVTNDFDFPYEQGLYIGQDNFKGYLPPMVICDIGFGTILKMVTHVEGNVTVTMEAELLETETRKDNFALPKGFTDKTTENTEVIE